MNKLFIHLTTGHICELVMCYIKNHKVYMRYKVYDDIDSAVNEEWGGELLEVTSEQVTDFAEINL